MTHHVPQSSARFDDSAGPGQPADATGRHPLVAEIERLRADLAAAHTKIDNLEIALRTSREIGMAIGVVMTIHRVTAEAAFDLLRLASQHTHRKLRDIAADVLYTGAIEAPGVPRVSAAGGARPNGHAAAPGRPA